MDLQQGRHRGIKPELQTRRPFHPVLQILLSHAATNPQRTPVRVLFLPKTCPKQSRTPAPSPFTTQDLFPNNRELPPESFYSRPFRNNRPESPILNTPPSPILSFLPILLLSTQDIPPTEYLFFFKKKEKSLISIPTLVIKIDTSIQPRKDIFIYESIEESEKRLSLSLSQKKKKQNLLRICFIHDFCIASVILSFNDPGTYWCDFYRLKEFRFWLQNNNEKIVNHRRTFHRLSSMNSNDRKYLPPTPKCIGGHHSTVQYTVYLYALDRSIEFLNSKLTQAGSSERVDQNLARYKLYSFLFYIFGISAFDVSGFSTSASGTSACSTSAPQHVEPNSSV